MSLDLPGNRIDAVRPDDFGSFPLLISNRYASPSSPPIPGFPDTHQELLEGKSGLEMESEQSVVVVAEEATVIRVKLGIKAIQDFQEATRFNPGDPIPVRAGRGWLLILNE